MKESRKLNSNNIYKIRLDNIEVDINGNFGSKRVSSRHNENNSQFLNPNHLQHQLNNSASIGKHHGVRCCCCCHCCNTSKDSSLLLSLINKSKKCTKCNSEFYDLNSQLSRSKPNQYSTIHRQSNQDKIPDEKIQMNTRSSYLDKINTTLLKAPNIYTNSSINNTTNKTSSPMLFQVSPISASNNEKPTSSNSYAADASSKQNNKIITSKLDYSQYIKSPLIQNIKLYRTSSKEKTRPVQAFHPVADISSNKESAKAIHPAIVTAKTRMPKVDSKQFSFKSQILDIYS
jgi:hypothetical protein